MVEIEVTYRDQYTGDRWKTQFYRANSVAECIRIYCLGVDCEYKILSVTEVN